jgi:hypothetical protein
MLRSVQVRVPRKRILVVLLLSTFTAVAFAQNESSQKFVIDASKPYVYLVFDHIGPRKPIQSGESNTGLWLRVVNNCRIPIVFLSFSMPPGISGVGLMDEVVWDEPMLEIYSTDAEGKEFENREKLRKSKHKPDGYSSETSGVTRMQPGTEILFSVPLNHVDEDWHMQIKGALDLNNSSASVGPYTLLQFYYWDIPKELRPVKVSSK